MLLDLPHDVLLLVVGHLSLRGPEGSVESLLRAHPRPGVLGGVARERKQRLDDVQQALTDVWVKPLALKFHKSMLAFVRLVFAASSGADGLRGFRPNHRAWQFSHTWTLPGGGRETWTFRLDIGDVPYQVVNLARPSGFVSNELYSWHKFVDKHQVYLRWNVYPGPPSASVGAEEVGHLTCTLDLRGMFDDDGGFNGDFRVAAFGNRVSSYPEMIYSDMPISYRQLATFTIAAQHALRMFPNANV